MDKAPDAFRTISEVAQRSRRAAARAAVLGEPLPQIKPMKRGGGRRYYRPDDVDLLRGIRHLLYGEGYTIRGVQRILREQGLRFVQNVWQPGAPQPGHRPSEDVGDDAVEPGAEPGRGPRWPRRTRTTKRPRARRRRRRPRPACRRPRQLALHGKTCRNCRLRCAS